MANIGSIRFPPKQLIFMLKLHQLALPNAFSSCLCLRKQIIMAVLLREQLGEIASCSLFIFVTAYKSGTSY